MATERRSYVRSHYEMPFVRWKAFSVAQPSWLWGQWASCPLKNISSNTKASAAKSALRLRRSLSVTKSYSFNHMIIPNQCAVCLFAVVLAEAITRVYAKLDQPPVNMLLVLSHLVRPRITPPFDRV